MLPRPFCPLPFSFLFNGRHADGSEAGVRAAGKLRMEGRKYTVADGDIIFFKFNVTTRAKK